MATSRPVPTSNFPQAARARALPTTPLTRCSWRSLPTRRPRKNPQAGCWLDFSVFGNIRFDLGHPRRWLRSPPPPPPPPPNWPLIRPRASAIRRPAPAPPARTAGGAGGRHLLPNHVARQANGGYLPSTACLESSPAADGLPVRFRTPAIRQRPADIVKALGAGCHPRPGVGRPLTAPSAWPRWGEDRRGATYCGRLPCRGDLIMAVDRPTRTTQ